MEPNPIQNLPNCSTGSIYGIPVDRISSLPEAVICYILSFLPTKIAFATSLFSKRWQLMWTQLTTLDFQDDENDNDAAYYDDDDDSQLVNFVHFVNKVLLHLRAESLEKFRLRWRNECQADCVNSWVSFGTTRNVAVLDLHIWPPEDTLDDYVVHLPCTVLTCGTLESLKLRGPFFIEVPTVCCLPKLVVLELRAVRYESDEAFFRLISGCPALHSLQIQRLHQVDNLIVCSISSPPLRRLQIDYDSNCPCRCGDYLTDNILKIDAPALEYFSLHGGVPNEFSVQRLSSVKEVDLRPIPYSIFDYRDDDKDDTYHYNLVVKLIQAIDLVKCMKLSEDVMMALSRATNRVSANFDRLTKLVINCDCWFEWSSLMELLSCSVKLEVLDIIFTEGKYEQTRKACWRDPKQVPRCMTHSLGRVSFSGFDGLKDEMAMIRFMLEHGLVMKTVNLCSTADPRDCKKKFLMLKKISMFPRASRLCKISFSLYGFKWMVQKMSNVF